MSTKTIIIVLVAITSAYLVYIYVIAPFTNAASKAASDADQVTNTITQIGGAASKVANSVSSLLGGS